MVAQFFSSASDPSLSTKTLMAPSYQHHYDGSYGIQSTAIINILQAFVAPREMSLAQLMVAF
jgi:hypothetical protein